MGRKRKSHISAFLLGVLSFSIIIFSTGCSIVGYTSGGKSDYARPVYHTVTQGETLFSISQQYGVAPSKVALLNGLRTSSTIYSGDRLLVGYRRNTERRDNSRVYASAAPGGGNRQIRGKPSRGRIIYRDGQLAWPVAGGQIVSQFGKRKKSFHDGIDIAAPRGTPVFAAHEGIVMYSGNGLGGYGNLVVLRSRSGLTTVYAHNRRLLVDVGELVRRGEKIAEVGSTGRSSGPHLHFEVRMRDIRNRYAAVNPLPFFKKTVDQQVDYRINESLTPIIARR